MKTIRLLLVPLALFALASCSGLNRMMSPGPAAQLRGPSAALAAQQTDEFDILRLRIMERMANGAQSNAGGVQ